ncbi:MAG TPA: hypothetical protein VGO63_01405 [Candidatus Paceibacterota bacterium]|jgi:hypothetical protein|nr:hypothetical protein [Candidatus Paceibacterota bacterium]
MKKTTKKGMSKGISKRSKVAMVGAGVAALSAVGAGAYYLLGPDGKKNQKKVSALAAKIKKEAITEYKKAKKASVPVYHKAVDVIAKNYVKQYKAHEKDINAIGKMLKSQFKGVKKAAKGAAKKTVKKTTKATKKRA